MLRVVEDSYFDRARIRLCLICNGATRVVVLLQENRIAGSEHEHQPRSRLDDSRGKGECLKLVEPRLCRGHELPRVSTLSVSCTHDVTREWRVNSVPGHL